jgi:RNA polymerase sigma-70 factor (ECF subfamily)
MSLNYLRDNKKRMNQTEISGLKILASDDSDNNKTLVKTVVRRAVRQLSEKQRRVFVLSHYLELSYKDIAEVTDYSISSIESLLFRARKRLKELLSDFYEELKK